METSRWVPGPLPAAIMTRLMSERTRGLAQQIAAAERSLLSLEALVAQTKEMIAITRNVVEEAKAELARIEDRRKKKTRSKKRV